MRVLTMARPVFGHEAAASVVRLGTAPLNWSGTEVERPHFNIGQLPVKRAILAETTRSMGVAGDDS